MKRVICSFANSKYKDSLIRLEKQIKEISFFDDFYLYTEADLGAEFREKFDAVLVDGSRGYGYWVWKPYVIQLTLSKLDEGDCLLYVDAGCHINVHGKKRLFKYFEILENSKKGVLSFQLTTDDFSYGFFKRKVIYHNFYLTRNWTKGDLLDYFGVRDNPSIVDTPQVLAGIILIRKSESTVELIQNWAKVYSDNFHLIDDSESISPNLDGFIENRHDQSVFSILCKIYKVDMMSTTEIQAEPAIVMNNPIIAIRDIGGRMAYKSFKLLRFTRILKSPFLFLAKILNREPKLIN